MRITDRHPSLAPSVRARLAQGLSPRELLEACLERVEAREQTVRAFVTMDIEAAREAADASAARRRAGRALLPIDGMPVALKDVMETLDLPTGLGSALFRNWRGGWDGAPAWTLKQAGAIILGKTVTTELAYSQPGPTTNPIDAARTAGGSSSGSGAAVAAGMVPVALGTQVGGSILRPASFCGVVGFKPTYGALNRGGSWDNFSQGCLGPISVTLEDGWTVCHEIAIRVGGDPGCLPFMGGALPAPARRPLALATLRTAGWALLDDASKVAFERFLERLRAGGVRLIGEEDSARVAQLERAIANAREVSQGISAWEMLWPHAELDHRAGDGRISAPLRRDIARGRAMTADQYAALLLLRDAMRDTLLALVADVDGCITVSAPGPAPVGLESTGSSVFNQPASAMRCPAISLPLLSVAGLPLGVQLLGYPGRDRDLSAIAEWVMEAEAPGPIG
jgi:Asp-tRNA(Asn)/Glu-tRNA(Gln) amidotransferase A subunit family amidase